MNEARAPVAEDDEYAGEADRGHAYDLSRLMAFSDGVFAIAVTLLVLNVPVPVLGPEESSTRLPGELLNTVPTILTFALSFFLVGFYWIRHHQLFRQLVSVNVWLLWLNLVVLFLVCLLPFSSGVIGRYYDTAIGAELYAVNLGAIAVSFTALFLYATRSHQVQRTPVAGTGFGRGVVLPIVVVAFVMLLAPFNRIAAYVSGVALMAFVGVYTAVPRALRQAPLRGTGPGRLRFGRSTLSRLLIAGDRSMKPLFRARLFGPEPAISVAGNSVEVRYRDRPPFNWRRQTAEFVLNTSIPWRFEIHGGLATLAADLSDLTLIEVDITGGGSTLELRLPHPSGTVPIRVDGGQSTVAIQRPDGVAVRAAVKGGVGRVRFDGRRDVPTTDDPEYESPDYAAATDRYDVEVAGGTGLLDIRTT